MTKQSKKFSETAEELLKKIFEDSVSHGEFKNQMRIIDFLMPMVLTEGDRDGVELYRNRAADNINIILEGIKKMEKDL